MPAPKVLPEPPLFPPHPLGEKERVELACSLAPHLERLANIHAEEQLPLIKKGEAEAIIEKARKEFKAAVADCADETTLMSIVRKFRSRINYVVAMTDFLDLASIADHMRWLSDSAQDATEGVAWWLCSKHSHGEEMHKSWFILALGKFGAEELNYSSDIDLIVITLPFKDEEINQDFIRLTRKLIAILSQPTADGIGWRVDLRLRPDPGAMPIAIRRDPALTYYESLGRTWERAAFIRARTVAGNLEEGQSFLDDIQPFVWRRHLDYTALDDMRIMLRREDRPPDFLGFSIKNGIGGIRSIEFFVHVQQLIAGGREPKLRNRRTDDALVALAEADWIKDEESQCLSAAYAEWRRLEHRLQMISDSQTHSLPNSQESLDDIARLCGHKDTASFCQALTALGDAVISNTDSLTAKISSSEEEPEKPSDDLLTSWLQGHGDIDDEVIKDTLESLGYSAPQNIIPVCEGWMTGRIAATRSEKSRITLAKLLPKLLEVFAETDHPDTSFGHFARLLDQLPASMQLLSLLEENTALANIITTIFASIPKLAETIANHPSVVDNLVYSDFWDKNIDWKERYTNLEFALGQAKDYEDRLNVLRQLKLEWEFQIATQLLTQTMNAAEAGEAFSHCADTIINAIIPHVVAHTEERHGTMQEGGLAILAFGRLGCKETTLTSDLDIIFIYDCDEGNQSAGQWYTRLAQAIVNALTAMTKDGRCYEVDMRLRPSGKSGPVAVHIDGFKKYQEEQAWLWEHMALLKARTVGGVRAEKMQPQIEKIIDEVIAMPRKKEEIITATTEMRERVRKAFSSKSDLRYREGGLMDLDFLIAMLRLMPEAAKKVPLQCSNTEAIPHLSKAELLDKSESEELAKSSITLNSLHHWIRLTNTNPDDKETPLPKPFQEACEVADAEALAAKLDSLTEPIKKALFERIQEK